MWLQVVVDIDGDGSFLMNCQELATAAIEGLETKVMILNNQHLGMVVQWEDRFYKANRAHTYLGRRVSIFSCQEGVEWSASQVMHLPAAGPRGRWSELEDTTSGCLSDWIS